MEILFEVASVKKRELPGSHEENLADIIIDQHYLIKVMNSYKEKFVKLNKVWGEELRKNQQDIRSLEPKLDDMKILRGDRHINMEDIKCGQEDALIVRLKESLTNEGMAPDDVCNVLETDLYEKEKLT